LRTSAGRAALPERSRESAGSAPRNSRNRTRRAAAWPLGDGRPVRARHGVCQTEAVGRWAGESLPRAGRSAGDSPSSWGSRNCWTCWPRWNATAWSRSRVGRARSCRYRASRSAYGPNALERLSAVPGAGCGQFAASTPHHVMASCDRRKPCSSGPRARGATQRQWTAHPVSASKRPRTPTLPEGPLPRPVRSTTTLRNPAKTPETTFDTAPILFGPACRTGQISPLCPA
jgi:hypothetical protein